MPRKRKYIRNPTHIYFVGEYKPGDPSPEGYVQKHEWARVQMRAGLKQIRCKRCRRWHFPQQVAGHVCTPQPRRG